MINLNKTSPIVPLQKISFSSKPNYINHLENDSFERKNETKINFQTHTEARDFFKKYGILGVTTIKSAGNRYALKICEMKIPNLKIANTLAQAIFEITQAANNENIFNNLIITMRSFSKTPWISREDEGEFMMAAAITSNKGSLNLIAINSDLISSIDKLVQENHENKFHGFSTLKGHFIHELAHICEYNTDLEGFKQRTREHKFTQEELNSAQAISIYAQTSIKEFLAEYLASKLEGFKYSKHTDKLFEKYWLGPKINFKED